MNEAQRESMKYFHIEKHTDNEGEYYIIKPINFVFPLDKTIDKRLQDEFIEQTKKMVMSNEDINRMFDIKTRMTDDFLIFEFIPFKLSTIYSFVVKDKTKDDELKQGKIEGGKVSEETKENLKQFGVKLH